MVAYLQSPAEFAETIGEVALTYELLLKKALVG